MTQVLVLFLIKPTSFNRCINICLSQLNRIDSAETEQLIASHNVVSPHQPVNLKLTESSHKHELRQTLTYTYLARLLNTNFAPFDLRALSVPIPQSVITILAQT